MQTMQTMQNLQAEVPRLGNAESSIRLGQRYGLDVWALKTGELFLERTGQVRNANVKRPGITPLLPSLKAAVDGVHASYGTKLVMGTDPEFFLLRSGQIVPAFDFLPDKNSAVDGLFWDGFQAETVVDIRKCNCRRPNCFLCTDTNGLNYVTCHQVLAQHIGRQMQLLAAKGFGVAAQPVWRVPRQMLELAGETQVSLGCDPSQNAYASKGRLVVEPRKLEWRFAGGHVHFTLPESERTDPLHIKYLVKTLDALVGIASVCLAQNYDHFIRRRYYGLAGEYRLPAHGLEWRTLSNFWLMHPQAFMLVFDLARHACNLGRARLRNIFIGQESAIRTTIDYCDVRSAKDFMHLNRDFYSTWAKLMYGTDKAFWQAIQGGIDKVIPNWGKDVPAAWKLSSDWREVPAWRNL